MPTVKFRTTEYGVIEHESGEYEIVKHVDMLDSIDDATDRIDELTE